MYQTADVLVCLGYFAAILVIGLFSSRNRHSTVSGYFRAGNTLPWYAIGFSIVGAGISSEQFVGEMGYAYKLGMPVANWEWLVLPALSALLWLFVPLYIRHNIATMPEYLERRYGQQSRTLYASLTVSSYVLVNFALVFYTGGFALEKAFGVPRLTAVWLLAAATGAYTVYGGLTAVAWTSSFQCVLLLGGGLYLFFAGLAKIDWNVAAMIGEGQRAHLFTPADHEVPWTALVVLMLSTNVWYYATNQYINQRCLAARDEWHAKTGVLFSAGLQLLIPLATCFPGMIYRIINPALENADATYPLMVAEVAPTGLRGLVIAAIISAIMSTISGLVNSTATLVTLDLVQRRSARKWSDAGLVGIGRISGAGALLIGAALAPLVMKWESIFRYAQDIWAPMAAPVVVVFMAGALWPGARSAGAVGCLWMSIVSVPFILIKALLADAGVHLLPPNLENSMVFAGSYALIAVAVMVSASLQASPAARWSATVIVSGLVVWLGAACPEAIALLLLLATGAGTVPALIARRTQAPHIWDRTMLAEGGNRPWYSRAVFWWCALSAILIGIYARFW